MNTSFPYSNYKKKESKKKIDIYRVFSMHEYRYRSFNVHY